MKITILKNEEAKTWKRLIWAVNKLKETFVPAYIVDGIIPIQTYPNGTFKIIPIPKPKVNFKVTYYKNPSLK